MDSNSSSPDRFTAWFVENYPSDTIISDPAWHAERIARFFRASLVDARRRADALDWLIAHAYDGTARVEECDDKGCHPLQIKLSLESIERASKRVAAARDRAG